jgi:hypothetical protein
MTRARACAALAMAAALTLSLLAGIAPAHAATTPGSTYFPLTPTRILDTREGTGAPAGPLGQDATLDLTVVGSAGVPATGVTAVVLNLTATDATAEDSYLTVYPAGTTRPVASNLNFMAGWTSTNLVTVAVPTSGEQAGKVTIYNEVGSVSVVADISGWYSVNGGAVGATYNPLPPARVLDTRDGTGGVDGPVLAGETIDVAVTGVGGVPATGVSAVVLNVTAAFDPFDPFGPESFLTVYPSGTERPLASNLNYFGPPTLPNQVIARVGTNGRVSMYNNLGFVNLLADVQGWYTSTGTTTGATYFPLSPARDLDTRNGVGTGGTIGRMDAGQTIDLTVAGVNGVPATGVAAVVLNVTAVDYEGPESFMTVYPAGGQRPLASNLNYWYGMTIPNLVTARVGADGKVAMYNDRGWLHVVADVQGWFLTNGG